jgi:hypothetical protein
MLCENVILRREHLRVSKDARANLAVALRDARNSALLRVTAVPYLHGFESLTSNLPSAPEMTKSL